MTVYVQAGRHAPARSHARAAGRAAGAGGSSSTAGSLAVLRPFPPFVISGGRSPGSTLVARPRFITAAAGAHGTGPLLRGEPACANHHREARHLPLRGLVRPPAAIAPALVAAMAITSTGPTRPRSKARCAAPLRQWHRCVESASGSIGALSPYKILLDERIRRMPNTEAKKPTIQVLERAFDLLEVLASFPIRCR